MKKFGFTLAEVLITLGIIGVVAALTAPSLVLNSRNESNAAKLSVIMSNLENAFSNAITSESVQGLDETGMWGKQQNSPAFVGQLGRYIHLSGITPNATLSNFYEPEAAGQSGVKTITGNNYPLGDLTALFGANTIPITLKNGGVVFINRGAVVNRQDNENAIRNQGGALINMVARVMVDVNGKSAPNRLGRDIFGFLLSNDGILYPQGGLDNAAFISNGANITQLWSDAGANDPNKCADGNLGNGLGCTGRLIQEGFKMNY